MIKTTVKSLLAGGVDTEDFTLYVIRDGYPNPQDVVPADLKEVPYCGEQAFYQQFRFDFRLKL